MFKVLIIFSFLVNAGWQTRTSPHFIIHYQSPDRQIVTELLDLLEDQYDRLTQVFETELIQTVNVYVHPGRSSLSESAGIDNPSEWLVGVAINDTHIHLISPLNPPGNHTRESVKKGLIHELVHICVASKTKTRLPLWLNEGMAVYFAGQTEFMREVPGILRSRLTAPTLDEFNDPEYFEQKRGYAVSYTVIEFIIHRYGREALSAFIQNYPDYGFLGTMSIMQMQLEWQDYLQDNYINPRPLQRWLDYRENVFEASLSPNPVRDYASLEVFTGRDGTFSLKVLDLWGGVMQVLYQRPMINGFHDFRIDAVGFPPGIYYLELQQGRQVQLIRFTK
ncbi:MAG: peptidase MA family metallohydrolase [Bacteroidota bacterium]|nr:peptidase MA family metallohydrolase [Bacteroidota bacterium]